MDHNFTHDRQYTENIVNKQYKNKEITNDDQTKLNINVHKAE